ncbi:initiation factor 2 subunit family-domain-containing protein [Cladochytrium replicatum]|nr:initiation factor 2 subunit family-domain-containing protein [Cladochytrium replicatum]
MRTAVKFLKNEKPNLPIEMPDKDAKEHLKNESTCSFGMVSLWRTQPYKIMALRKSKTSDVLMTYARSSVVIQLLLKARAEMIDFRVFIVDSRPTLEETLNQLVNERIDCSYVLLNSVSDHVTVFGGASAVMSNGAVMSRIGTAVIGMVAHDAQLPPIVICAQLMRLRKH